MAALAVSLLLSGCTSGLIKTHGDERCTNVEAIPENNLLLFGEMHGSVETPALISAVTCSLARSHAVAVGLEIPSAEQGRIDVYLASRGTKSDKLALTQSDFWRRDWDGRSSVAMFRLIDDIRALKARGASVDVFAFDDQPGTSLERNQAIAEGIRRYRVLHPDVRIVALMGNVHASQAPMAVKDKTIVPSGMLLADFKPVSVLVAYPDGTIWACLPDCGVHEVHASKGLATPLGFSTGASWEGYSYTFSLPSITAAMPAVGR
jgi:hypothetical protein